MPSATTARPLPPTRRGLPAAAAALGLALAACASAGGRAPLPEPGDEACRPTGESAVRAGDVAVAAAGDVDPLHAPVPSSDAERVLFRHLYATLVGVDCEGRVRPGLAESWSADRDGTRWIFRLDPDARFADGSPVTAGAVVTSWHETDLSAGTGRPSPLDGVAVSAPSERRLAVTLEAPLPEPAYFAEPRFAVTGSGGGSAWPLPSGSHRPAAAPGPALPGRTVGLAPRETAAAGVVHLVASGTVGPRDLVDAGADVVPTRDPAAARYAGSLPGYRVHPLPWDRTWLLALPGAADADEEGEDGAGWETVRRGLAGEAIPAEARPAADGAPWAACPAPADGAADGARATPEAGDRPGDRPATPLDRETPRGRAAPASGGGRGAIVYPAGAPSGRALAARLAALAGGAGPGGEMVARALASGGAAGSGIRTEGLGGGAYERALRAGSAAGFLLALPRRSLAPCRLRREVLRRVPWLGDRGRVVPLVDTRGFLVLRRGLAGVRIDWDGTPRLEAAGWSAAAGRPARDAAGEGRP